ncbi:MAG TPA: histidine kinase [Opitutaceae bacterium]|nr:histidine kinase [Opitutaceae bacterium]
MDASAPVDYFSGMRRFLSWLLVALAACWLPEAEAQPADIRLMHGDDPRWSAPDWDDSDWTRIKFSEFPAHRGVFWVRIRMAPLAREASTTVPDRYSYLWPSDTRESPIDALFVSSVYSFELFLDGHRLAAGGVVGSDRESERTGPLDHLIRIPDALLGKGRPPVLAVRMSSYHYNFPATQFSTGFQPVNFAQRLRHETLQPVFPLVGAVGSLLMAATGAVLFWFIERRQALALVTTVSVVLAVFYGLIALRWLQPYTYDWHYPRLLTITWVLTVASGLIVWLLLELFAVPRKIVWLVLLVPILALAWQVSSIYELKVLWICRSMLLASLAIAAWACWKRRRGAWIALTGVVVALLVVRTERRVFLDPTFFMMIEGLVLFVFAALGAQVQAERKRAREAQLTAARMEVELLKKNLQPHFLLNTLAVLTEIVEQDPRNAVKLINDLADELRSLSRISAEKLIPLAQELELCRAHLRVMSVRTGSQWSLDTTGVDESTPVPPALFLTLIENGMVHQKADCGAVFRLKPTDDRAGFSFVSPGRTRESTGRPIGGTGLRYVKARLEESFPGSWTLDQGAVDDGWETVIRWKAGSSEGGRS